LKGKTHFWILPFFIFLFDKRMGSHNASFLFVLLENETWGDVDAPNDDESAIPEGVRQDIDGFFRANCHE